MASKRGSSTSKATAKVAKSQPKAQRHSTQAVSHGVVTESYVERIAGMMRRLEWRTGTSGPKLAAELALTEQYIRLLAAEASKRVRAESDLTYVKDKTERALEDAIDKARDTGDLAALINASKALATVAGTTAPTKTQEVTNLDGKSEVELAEMFVAMLDARSLPIFEAALKKAKKR